MLEVEHLLACFLFGSLKDVERKAYLGGYLEGKRAAGMAYGKAIEGGHAFGVEEHGAVDDAVVAVGHHLEVSKMSGDNAERASLAELFEHCLGDGAARARLGAAAQLVQKEQRTIVGDGQQLFHILQMRRVGTQVVLYRLLVANVYHHPVEDAELGGLATWRQQSALQHILYQTHRL